MIDVVGDAERRAVGQQAGDAAHRELAERQQVGVEFKLRQTPGERAQPGGAGPHQPFEIAVLLLQVLRLEEQPSVQTTLFSQLIVRNRALAGARLGLDGDAVLPAAAR